MPKLDRQLDEWLGHVLVVRSENLSTRWDNGLLHPYLFSDNTCAIIRGDVVVDNGCPLEPNGSLIFGLGYEWGPTQQRIFEDTIGPHLDTGRWDGIVSEFRTHWANTCSVWGDATIHWLEALAPGVRPVLHQLGKTVEFRDLRSLRHERGTPEILVNNVGIVSTTSFQAEEIRSSIYTRPVTIGDERLTVEPRERSQYRAELIAARGMTEWFSHRHTVEQWTPQTCVICEEFFWPNALNDTDIRRTGRPRYCHLCSAMMRRDPWALRRLTDKSLRPILITIAQRFLELTGMFPHSKIRDTSIGGLPEDQRDTFARLLMLIPRSELVIRLFGSWSHYLNAAGLLEKADRKGYSGYITIANDGHIALSIGERIICDWLHARGIGHEKEPVYPHHPELNPNKKLRGDWLIGDCWVELAGYMDDAKYANQMLRKQELARACGLRHLLLLPAELGRLDAIAREHWGWAKGQCD